MRLRPIAWIMPIAWITLFGATGFLAWQLKRRDKPAFERYLTWAVTGVGRLLQITLFAIGGIALTYLASILYGLFEGFALPNTAVFFIAPWTEELARYEPAFPYAMMILAMSGAVMSWVALTNPKATVVYRYEEYRLLRIWRAALPLIVLATLLFSVSGPWHGVYRPGDYTSSAISGLVPFSDAGGHFAGPYRQAMTGLWDPWVLRRPAAAATKTLVAFSSGYSAITTLLVQITALAAATFAATWAVTSWRGIWSGVTFFSLVLVLVRPFLPTHLTEPWGLFWALVAVPFLVYGLRPGGVSPRIPGLIAVSLSLLTRMGSMFTIPALAVWTLWANHHDRVRTWRSVSAVGLSLVLMLAINSGLARLYGTADAITGANFAYTLCGLTHGGTWDLCESLYAEDLANAQTEAEGARILSERALTRFKQNPWTLFNRLVEGERYFLENLHVAMLYGFGSMSQSPLPSFPSSLWYIVGALGLLRVLVRARERYELSFWIMMALGLLTSAPWVIFDDGWRVLSSSFVFIALLAASGFSTPIATVSSPTHAHMVRVSRGGLAAISVILCLWFAIPALAYKIDVLHAQKLAQHPAKQTETIMLGGRHPAALLVIPDGATLPNNVPAVHYSNFVTMVEASNIQHYQKLLTPSLTGRQFGFVMSPGPGRPGIIFITPPEVVTDREVKAWRLQLSDDGILRGPYFFLVKAATPVEGQAR